LEVAGRIKIFTDEKEINRENIIPVLQKAYSKHRINSRKMQDLIDYEAGKQKLPFVKEIRPEISIETADNEAHYITNFHKGYFWSVPAVFTQRGNKEHHKTDESIDSLGISALNEMMLNGISISAENQELGDFVEKVGVGYFLVDIKTEWEDEEIQSSYVNVCSLDPRNTFLVHYNGIYKGKKQPKVLSVTFSKSSSGKLFFTCFTDELRFEISGWNIDEETVNPLGMNPIVLYMRDIDCSGCFEHYIPLMDDLNSQVTNIANDIAQRVQEIWWGNDIDFPKDKKTGETIKPRSGQWVLTYSGEGGKNPKIQPMSGTFETSSALQSITDLRNEILKKCYVPRQANSDGGGSTGLGGNVIYGWDETETDANRKEQLREKSDRELLKLIIKAIKFVPTKILPENSPLRNIHSTDIDIHYSRRKDYDAVSEANAYATWISHGIDPRHALKRTKFSDTEQVYIDSKDNIERYLDSVFDTNENNNPVGGEGERSPNEDRLDQDISDQKSNSPNLNG